MKQQQSGFTLIELIAVIVILGILAAVAVPKFVDLSDEAQAAATRALAGNLGSAGSLNYAQHIATQAGLSTETATTVDNCQDAEDLLEGGSLPANYTITAAAADNSGPTDCSLSGPQSTSATFQLMGTVDPAAPADPA